MSEFEKEKVMSILMNRTLDVMVSFAAVGLALIAAGAIAVLGA